MKVRYTYNTICCSSYIREIGLLLPDEPILYSQIMFTMPYLYNLLISLRCDTVSKLPRCDIVSKLPTYEDPYEDHFPNNDIKFSDIVHYGRLFTMWPLSLQTGITFYRDILEKHYTLTDLSNKLPQFVSVFQSLALIYYLCYITIAKK